ncbi:YraN family protein [Arthrobacter sp. APC 3897]|uniref:YraN family protein n=1 Tax=Arthrobacter sp. APC 3897 TaxID=3035204 RepID=UPI0025B336EC|nr:YraN family protein [Arthrobacter sp. APC 3897]MDN3482307.1 YraN family protein [Arthrobacter sp. APC 3897]
MRAKDTLGQRGEELAAIFLTAGGIEIVDRNWRCPDGEIDLVGVDGETLVIVEVKTRSSLDYGDPLEAITPAKLARLYLLASRWRRASARHYPAFRVDAVSVLDNGSGAPVIEHLKEVAL